MKILYLSPEKTHYELSEIKDMIDAGQAVDTGTFGHAGFCKCIGYGYNGESYLICPGNNETTLGNNPEIIGRQP